MMTDWKEDNNLRQSLDAYVKRGLKRLEILDYVKRDFSSYCWSIRTLDRRLRHFEIFYIDCQIDENQVANVVFDELEGPGQLLGYRAMHRKIRVTHNLKIPRNIVHKMMKEADPEGMEQRTPAYKKKKKKGCFTSPGTNWVHSLDGHDKLMGYQNSTFPISVYGCMDTCSRKLLWVKVWTSNKNPKLIGRLYLEYLAETKVIPQYLRLDRGTETGIMATMHAYLQQNHGSPNPADTVLYGPSTSNQIERWWKELHERLEKFFKVQLSWLKERAHYIPSNLLHRCIIAYIMVPLMQNQIDEFVDVIWNSHRIRGQKGHVLPSGILNHIYDFPEHYGLKEWGTTVSESELKDVAAHSGVLEVGKDFIPMEIREACEKFLPNPECIDPGSCGAVFCRLKQDVERLLNHRELCQPF